METQKLSERPKTDAAQKVASAAAEVNMNGADVAKMKGAVLTYKLPLPLDTHFATSDGVVKTKEGEVPYVAGDAIMTGTQGEQWPIVRKNFEATYEPVNEGQEMGSDGKYAKRKIMVFAVRMETPFTVNVSWQDTPLHGQAGDWLVQYGKDDYGIVVKSIFEETYVEGIQKPSQKE
jgi:hypothetical protein